MMKWNGKIKNSGEKKRKKERGNVGGSGKVGESITVNVD